jgi:hypothetical protein
VSAQPDGTAPQPPGSGSQSLQATTAKLGEQARERSPFMFLVIGLCFFLPFVSVSCNGQDLATMSGVQLVTGAEVEIAPELVEELNNSFGVEEGEEVPNETEEADPSIWAIIALAAAVLGVVVGFATKRRARTLASLAAALLGLVGLIGLRFDLQVDVEGAEGISIRYRLGYWIAALLFAVLALAHGTFLRGRSRAGP